MNAESYNTSAVSDLESLSKPSEDDALQYRLQQLFSTVFSADTMQVSLIGTSSARVLFYASLQFRPAS